MTRATFVGGSLDGTERESVLGIRALTFNTIMGENNGS